MLFDIADDGLKICQDIAPPGFVSSHFHQIEKCIGTSQMLFQIPGTCVELQLMLK